MTLLPLALLIAAPIGAAQDERATVATPAEQVAIAQAAARGALIHAYDQAAWHGTDDMLAKLPDAAGRVGGWVVVGNAEAPTAIFFDKAATEAVYLARFERGRLVEGKLLGAGDDRRLTPEALRLIAALKAARAAVAADRTLFTCGDKPFNTVVLPAEAAGGAVAVYFMTPQTSSAAIPFGGHYRVEVDAAGRAGAARAFSRACLPMATRPPGGARAAGLVVSHLLDPFPTEIHVFSSLTLRRPVYVATMRPNARLWVVTGSRIEGPRPLPTR